MKKSYYVFLSVLIFLIISPFFNGLFTYLFLNMSSGKMYLGTDDFTFLLFIAYIVTLTPALLTGCLYGLLSPTRKNSIIRWLVPLLGCVIYMSYIFILQILFKFLGSEGEYFIIIFSLLSIGGSFVSTIIANISLKERLEQPTIQTK